MTDSQRHSHNVIFLMRLDDPETSSDLNPQICLQNVYMYIYKLFVICGSIK